MSRSSSRDADRGRRLRVFHVTSRDHEPRRHGGATRLRDSSGSETARELRHTEALRHRGRAGFLEFSASSWIPSAASASRAPGGLCGRADEAVGAPDEIAQRVRRDARKPHEHARIVDVVIRQVIGRRVLLDQQVALRHVHSNHHRVRFRRLVDRYTAKSFPRTFSACAPHVVVTSTSGSYVRIAIAASNPLRFTAPMVAPAAAARPASEPEQAVDLDDDGPVPQRGKAAAQRVAFLVVDDEQLAPRLVLPA